MSPKNDNHYGTYNADINHPFSSRLSVEDGSKPKGRPMKNVSCEMTALPSFINRLKATKVGKQVHHIDGVAVDSPAELSDSSGQGYTGIQKHIIAMSNDGVDGADDCPFF
jgi:hypothetical protein